MRRSVILFALTLTVSLSIFGQASDNPNSHRARSADPTQCRADQLSIKHLSDDAAMGGVRIIDFSYTNTSSNACTLIGYPRFETLTRAGKLLKRGRAVNRREAPELGDEAPKLVTIEPGKTAWFRIHFNAGGAGYLGKPCPESYKVRVTAPGTTRAKVLREGVQHCGGIEISAVMAGAPE